MAINSLSAASYGFSGLASGMDTESMVEDMLAGTQGKIDKANQTKAWLELEQTMYRDVSTQLRTLQSSFLSFTSDTNLLSSSFYNTMTSTVNPPSGLSAAFSVTAGTTASIGTTSMDYIKQLATARTEKTQTNASGPVSGMFDHDAAEELFNSYRGTDATLTIRVGDKVLSIPNAPMELGGKSPTEVADYLNELFNSSSNPIPAEARFTNNKLQIIADDSDAYIEIHGNKNSSADNPTLAMSMFGSGLTEMSGQGEISASVDTELYQPSFTVDLDGRTQQIYIDLKELEQYVNATDDASAEIAKEAMVNTINDQLKRYFGSGVSASYDSVTGEIGFDSGSVSQKFTITGETSMMGMLGIENGMSNKLNTNIALKDLNFSGTLMGNKQTFSVNGVEFSYDSSVDLATILDDINASKAGVKISYLESEDRFVVKSAETGAGGIGFDVEQIEGNLMSMLFGAAGGSGANGYGINMDMVAGEVASTSDFSGGGVFTFNVNGSDVKFTISKNEGETITASSLASKLNEAFRDTYGYMSDGTQRVQFILNDEDKFVIRSNDEDYIIKTVSQHDDTNMSLLGFSEDQATLAMDGNVTLQDIGVRFSATDSIQFNVGGTTFALSGSEIAENTTMNDLAAQMTAAMRSGLGLSASDPAPTVTYDEKTGSFRLDGYEDAAGNPVYTSISLVSGGAVTPRQFDMSISGLEGSGTNLNISLTEAELEGKSNEAIAALINEKITEHMASEDAAIERPTVEWDAATNSYVVASGTMNIASQGYSGQASSKELDKLFGQSELIVNQAEVTGQSVVIDAGKNAVFSINGSEIERATNTFAIDGVSYTLHDTTVDEKTLKAGLDASTMTEEELANHENYDYEFQKATQISITRDTEKIVEGVQEFLKIYNETIDFINELYKAEATYKDYPPLSDEEKAAMSDREIELWEEKSKEGLLRNDQYLGQILDALRTAMYTKPEGSSIAIYDLGISTSFYSEDGHFNAESVDDLRQAIESNPEALQELFAGEGGIMELVNNAINDATKSSYASPGYLVAKAGSNSLDTSSSLYKEIAEVDEQLVTLEDRYWSEYDRYWGQFNQMEELIAQMNAQSAQMTQLMGG